MKIRNGFVSNSSSSSFICCISGEVASGFGASLEEVCMVECEHGHTMDEDYFFDYIKEKTDGLSKEEFLMLLPDKSYKYDPKNNYRKRIREYLEKVDADYGQAVLGIDYGRDSVPESLCPVCQLKYFTDDMIVRYFLSYKNKTRKRLEQEIREQFSSPKDFWKFIKN